MSGFVLCRLPKTGLGNQLFPLLKSAVFANLNRLPLIVVGYNQFKIGPYLRGEKIKRRYNGYFNFQKNIFGEQIDRFIVWRHRNFEKVEEPAIEKIADDQKKRKQFIFSAIPHWEDYFEGLRENRELVIELFWKMINKSILRKLETLPVPCIGVHIRMGDFRKLKEGEDFKKTGAVRTPEDYFIEIINAIRRINNSELPVCVFTDGYREEIPKLLSLKRIEVIEGNKDIVDMLLLSKSKIIVASAGSTFSYWAGFLSDSPLIMHADHLHEFIRPQEINRIYYEGPLHPDSPNLLLQKNIELISQ
ncbi:MAG: alpha-1,2-fucosyltransferase [Bacteroidetes bacterium]|nr:alpha-1,2-fucosyltransferase [Bacteroidota bacterium]